MIRPLYENAKFIGVYSDDFELLLIKDYGKSYFVEFETKYELMGYLNDVYGSGNWHTGNTAIIEL